MNRLISFCMLLLLQLAAHAQDTRYTLTLNVPDDGKFTASAYGRTIYDRRMKYAEGEEVHLTGTLHEDYGFVSWTDESGNVVCDSLNYTFVMPAHDVTFTAHTVYDPVNPPGPREDGFLDTWNHITLQPMPNYGGTISVINEATEGGEDADVLFVVDGNVCMAETGTMLTVKANPLYVNQTRFVFAGWQIDGETVSTDNPYTFEVPAHDMTLCAIFDYDPVFPPNPHDNYWNKESGELIVSTFSSGHLYEKLNEVLNNGRDWSLVKSATVVGKCTDENLTYGDYPTDIYAFSAFGATNVEYLDYSRTSGITKIDIVNKNLCSSKVKTLVLPSSIEDIYQCVFSNLTELTDLTCFATTPPTLHGYVPGDQYYESGSGTYQKWAFYKLDIDNIIVHVPAEAIPLYQAARGWEQFIILPITQQVSRVTVTLPEAKTYKDMFLELVNAKTGQKQRYVVSQAATYTFNNVIHGTTHNLYLKNGAGTVLGQLEGIEMVDKDVEVNLADVKTPVDLTLQLLAPDGTVLPTSGEGAAATVTWTDRQGNFLATGGTLSGQVEGSQVRYHVKLNEVPGKQYLSPADSLCTVTSEPTVSCRLSMLPRLTVGGVVTSAETGLPVRNANVAVSQLLNGLYSVTQGTLTAADGTWQLTVVDAPSSVTVSHADYVKQTIAADTLSAVMPTFVLRSLSGTIVDLDFYYRPTVHDGEESQSEDFTDAENVSYTVYDESRQQDLTDRCVVQSPLLVLADQELPEGTRLRITATSITDKFMPVSTTCTVDSTGHATATLGITELGQLEATFEMTDNAKVSGSLYDADGQLVGWAVYSGTRLGLANLKDGNYTLVTMGYNPMFASVSSLDRLEEFGLTGNDMVKNEVTLRSGHVTTVTNKSIPLLDDTRYVYTSGQTTVSANKDEVSVGQYVVVRADLHFKPEYADALSKVRLQFDLPEGCELVEGSVMVGQHTADYESDGRQLTVLTGDAADSELVRFCVVATEGGQYEVSAATRFRLNGQTMLQPLGAIGFTASDLTIVVPETTARRTLPVTGMAVPLSQVDIYDGDVLIGQTTSLGTGFYSLTCPLNKPYNLSEHTICAIVTTPEGLQIQSETKTVEINRAGLTPVVSCVLQSDTHEHKHFEFKWDFRTNTVTPTYAMLTTSSFNNCHQIFDVNFYDENDMVSNDTTVVRDVTLYVMTTRGDIRVYPLNYSERHKSWWMQVDWHDRLPVNVDLDYTIAVGNVFDREEFDDMLTDLQSECAEVQRLYADLKETFSRTEADPEELAVYTELGELLDKEELSDEDYARLRQLTGIIIDDPDIQAEADREYGLDFSEVDALLSLPELTEEQLTQLSTKLDSLESCLKKADDPAFQLTADDMAWLAQQKNTTAALNGQMYDYVYDKFSLFFPDLQGDMPSPDEEGTYYLEPDSLAPGRTYTVEHLSSIDPAQLAAEGFTRHSVTDGTDIYSRIDANSFIYIDTKNMTKRTIIIDEERDEAAYDRRRAMNLRKFYEFVPAHCRKDWDKRVMELKRFYEQMKDAGHDHEKFRTCLANAGSTLTLCTEALGCMWGEGLKTLEKFIYQNFGIGIQEEIDKEVQKIEQRKATPNKKLAQCQTNLENSKKLLEHRKNYEKVLRRELRSNHLSPSMRKTMEQQLASLDIDGAKRAVDEAKDAFKPVKDYLKNLDNEIKVIKKQVKEIFKFQGPMKEVFERLPKNIAAIKVSGKTIIKGTGLLGKVFGTVIGSFLQIIPMVILIDDNSKDIGEWNKLKAKVDAYYPCPGDEGKYNNIVMWFKIYYQTNTSRDIEQVLLDAVLIVGDVIGTAAWPVWLACRAGNAYSCYMAFTQPRDSREDRYKIGRELEKLNCKPNDDPIVLDPENPPSRYIDVINTGDTHGFKSINRFLYWHPRFENVGYIMDPSGYVYEAVNSNRVEGVTATCYYKEEREDAYGDLHEEVVLWDAERYAQENPLFTDADGRYRWDVPRGLWQVKYEKQGYETTYSDWLPVPPPQLEVNVGITQLLQPQVKKVRAYEDGIDITFDKYMRPHTLAGAISVVKDGQTVAGNVELLDAESGYQTPDSVYASKVRFNVNADLNAGDHVQLTVKRTAESYAGMTMEEDFTQEFGVGQRISALVADSVVNVQEGKELKLTVRATPAAAAVGKKLTVMNSDAGVVSSSAPELTIDQNGEATLPVSALAEGSAFVSFTLADDEELTTATLVMVRDSAQMQVSTPRASRLNGSTLYKGTEVELTCTTGNARILYTLNGACPCDVGNKSVYTYTQPIVVTDDSITIKAMAIAPGMDDSPVAEFTFKTIARPVDIKTPETTGAKADGPTRYFLLDGRRTTKPQRGLVIERRGSQSRLTMTR